MEALQPCPNCLSDVDVICVNRQEDKTLQDFFFVHCNECGKGTSKAYPSVSLLTAIWNALALEKPSEQKS